MADSLLCKTCQKEWRRKGSAYGEKCAAKFIFYTVTKGMSSKDATARIKEESPVPKPKAEIKIDFPQAVQTGEEMIPEITKIKPPFFIKMYKILKQWLKPKLPL